MLRRSHSPLDYCSASVFAFTSKKREEKIRKQCNCGLQMRQQIKIARTVFSLIAIACSIVVVSWVGLALLGF
jgi:hypothetical protein